MMSLREARVKRLLSLRQLARQAGVALDTVQAIESGRQVPHLGTVAKLSRALGVEPSEILEFQNALDSAARGKVAA